MEAIGAVASILQVAQIGTQLSIGLFQIADAIASANQETNYIAKDIALFCQVLKDLAKAIEFGQKAQLFRQDAFDTSIKIVDECKRVFTEIEDILKKATKSDNPLASKFRVPTGHKIMWIFRKGKVEFWNRSNRPYWKDTVDVDELLALKSLVLANEAAKQEFHHQAESSGEMINEVAISSSGVSVCSRESKVTARSLSADDGSAPTATSHSQAPRTAEATKLAPSSQFIVSNSPHPYWSQIDRLELAAQKLELAKWEYSRLEENIALGKARGSIDSEMKHEFLMDRIKSGLTKFGMREELVDAAISTLKANGAGPMPERIPIYPVVSRDSEQLAYLRPTGLVDLTSTDHSKEVVIMRWLPDMFVDVLYEHTQDLLENSGVPRQKILEAPRSQASEQHLTMGREANHPLLSTDQRPQNRNEPPRGKKRRSQSIGDAHPTNVSGKRQVHWDSHNPKALDEKNHPEDILEQSAESEPEILQEYPQFEDRGFDKVDLTFEANEDDENFDYDDFTMNYSRDFSPFDERKSERCELFDQDQIIDGDSILVPERRNTGHALGKGKAPEPGSGTSFLPPIAPQEDASGPASPPRPIDLANTDPRIPSIEELLKERNHELANDMVRDWLNKHDLQFHAEADTQPDIVPDPLVSTQEPEIPSTAVQLVRPGQDYDQPTPVQVPETANASMQKFRDMSSDTYQASLAATWGTASVNSNYDLDAYLERRRKGIEGCKDFFMDAEGDKSLQAVQELLLKWTTVDDPVVWENNGKQLRLLTQRP
ncbi:hypothetical protein J3E71DRAFT_354567 [Bipolaris maydis]|nr:hypothetical protein J3E71DRAFT_354567 [Bipolaris maydis]